MQRTLSYSELRRNLKSACDRVCDEREPVLVKRRSGGDVVLVARDDYEALEETAYLLSSPENARRLLEALRRPRAQRTAFATARALADEAGA
jgi:antitoxin YefM